MPDRFAGRENSVKRRLSAGRWRYRRWYYLLHGRRRGGDCRSGRRPILRRRRRRRLVHRVVGNDWHWWRRGHIVAAHRPVNRRCRTVVSEPVRRTRYDPFEGVSEGIEDIGEERERLRIFVVIFPGVLLIVVVVLRVRNCGQANEQRGAENNCN